MAHLNCLPPRAAGVNYWFFLLAHLVVGVGIKQNAKCEMLLRKIDGEMNVQNGEFSAKLRMKTVATCSTTDGNGSYHGLSPSFFEEMTRCRRQNIAGDDQTTLMVHQFRKYRVFLPLLRLFTSVRSLLLFRSFMAAAGATHPHRHISNRLHVADVKTWLEMTR